MIIAIASDHAGFPLKSKLCEALLGMGHQILDGGPESSEKSVDYPDYAHWVADKVANKQAERGILICGSGIGMAMSANRHPGIRAFVARCQLDAHLARSHNDANVLALGDRITGILMAEEILKAFLNTSFEGGRHIARVKKIENGGYI